jgi:ABC-type glycerol-3-phosphate transport system substrate-binding protein
MRRISMVAGAVVAGLVLASCGSDGGGSSTESSKEVEVFTWWTEGGE